MASLLTKLFNYQASIPVSTLTPLDNDQNQLVGANGVFVGGSTDKKLLTKSSDAVDPPYDLDQLGAGPLARWKQNGVTKAQLLNNGDLVSNGLTGAAGVYTFNSIPLLPAVDPTTANQAARKQYVDNRQTRWSASFVIADIAARGLDFSFDNIQGAWIPGGSFTATHIGLKFNGGTASGSFSVEFRKQAFGSGAQTLLGTITVNPGTLFVGIEVDIADHLFTANDFVYPVLVSISSSLHKSVWISIRGFQIPQ